MTESFYPVTAITGHIGLHAAHANHQAHLDRLHHGAPSVDTAQEDDGEISCFCGFGDDDGNTVACDVCSRWQHIICYYPEYEGQGLPADLQHFCVECRPRPVDAHAAHGRQRTVREHHQLSYNGVKRPPAKSHKKKVKESPSAPYTNGWPVDKVRHDRNSASPRDQPPPAKRPKTSHRTSDSNAFAPVKGNPRKRNLSNMHHRSISQSPDSPTAMYSEEFLRSHQEDDWTYSEANVMDALQVTNHLSRWLQLSNEDFYDEIQVEKGNVLNRWDKGTPDDIPGKPQIEVVEQPDITCTDSEGNNPSWKAVISHDALHAGAYIGELRGRIGLKDEYKRDPVNRWSKVRHPEPFVFFHPSLPIYIDARHEGTDLRFVRRSCQPNARLQVLVTKGTDYHFCFMASTLIESGTEISIGWDTAEMHRQRDSTIPRSVESIDDINMDELRDWVSSVLSNCGPCACQRSYPDCAMSRFDRRRMLEEQDDVPQPVKASKLKKKRLGQHISPLNTHSVNSRSGSEARKVGPDEDIVDSRSVSESVDRASASRDNTPNTYYSANGSLTLEPKISERERKKLAKEEEMFRRQEEEKSGKIGKKKRNSAGSNVTTPSVTSSKQLGLHALPPRTADAGTPQQPALISAKSVNGKRPRASTNKTPVKSAIKNVKRQKPLYVESE
ncbi:hypothetical protein BAUCODRAFT_95505, partial [Baudoinia panamericana UAMH 10762]